MNGAFRALALLLFVWYFFLEFVDVSSLVAWLICVWMSVRSGHISNR